MNSCLELQERLDNVYWQIDLLIKEAVELEGKLVDEIQQCGKIREEQEKEKFSLKNII